MRIFTIITLVLLTACNVNKEDNHKVMHAGAMKDIMHKHDYSAKADLDTIDHKNLYALGAIEGVKGEVFVWDGNPYMSVEKNGNMVIDNDKHKASLLVYAQVPKWKRTAITNATSIADLEHQLTALGQEKPFPFIIKGIADSLHWHIVNVDPKHPDIPHKKTGLQGIITGEKVDILGFYSEHAQGIYTHHDSKVHIHFKTQSGELAGHVDGLHLSNVEVLIPKL